MKRTAYQHEVVPIFEVLSLYRTLLEVARQGRLAFLQIADSEGFFPPLTRALDDQEFTWMQVEASHGYSVTDFLQAIGAAIAHSLVVDSGDSQGFQSELEQALQTRNLTQLRAICRKIKSFFYRPLVIVNRAEYLDDITIREIFSLNTANSIGFLLVSQEHLGLRLHHADPVVSPSQPQNPRFLPLYCNEAARQVGLAAMYRERIMPKSLAALNAVLEIFQHHACGRTD